MAVFRILLTCGLFLFAGAADLNHMRKRLKQRFQTGQLLTEGQGKDESVSKSLEKSLLGKQPVIPAKVSNPKKFMAEDLESRGAYWDDIVKKRKKAAKKVKKAKVKLILAKREDEEKSAAVAPAIAKLKETKAAYHAQSGPVEDASAALEKAKIAEVSALYKYGDEDPKYYEFKTQVETLEEAKAAAVKEFVKLRQRYFKARQVKRDATEEAADAKQKVSKAFTEDSNAEYAYSKTVEDTKERLKHWVEEDLYRKTQLHHYTTLAMHQTMPDIDHPLVGAESLETIEYDTQNLMKTLEEELKIPLDEEKELETEIEEEIQAELTDNNDELASSKFEADMADEEPAPAEEEPAPAEPAILAQIEAVMREVNGEDDEEDVKEA